MHWRPEAVQLMRSVLASERRSITLGPKSRRRALAKALAQDGMLQIEHYANGRRLVTYSATAAAVTEFDPSVQIGANDMTAAAALKAPIPPSNETGIPAELKKSGEAPKRGIYERINAVMRDVRGVGKSKENRQFGYSYAGHEDVTEALRDAYSTHGIVRSATVLSTQIIAPGTVLLNVRVSWVCHDEPSSLHAVEIPALQTSSRKDRDHDPMQIGKALSYAVKNAEFKIFALTGDDTPDVEEDDVDRGREPPRNGASGGPSSDNGAPRDEGEALARGYIDRFGKVQTDKELSDLNAEARANWARFRHVPGVAERMVAAKKRASERLRQKAPQQRQPGED